MSKKGGRGAPLQEDVPWRAAAVPGTRPIPKINYSPLLQIPQSPYSDYALSVMKVIIQSLISFLVDMVGWF